MIRRTMQVLAMVSLAAWSTVGCSGADDLDGDEVSESDDEALKSGDTYNFKVITHNIAGAMKNLGAVDAVDYAVAEAKAFGPDAMMLQEVCETQASSLRDKLGSKWTVYYVKTYDHKECGSLGSVIASPHPMTQTTPISMTDPFPADPKDYKAVCGDIAVPNRKGVVHVCSTHLISTGNDKSLRDETEKARGKQVKQLIDGVHSYLKKNDPVVIAGDFNAGPNKELMDPLFRVTRQGTFGNNPFDEADQTDSKREQHKEAGVTCAPTACRSGQNTHENSKLDQILFSHERVAGVLTGDVRSVGKSDHNLYRGTAQLKLKKK
jgi:endonuclease/exonuclease/phosphatase family metal-dependent hydrolase